MYTHPYVDFFFYICIRSYHCFKLTKFSLVTCVANVNFLSLIFASVYSFSYSSHTVRIPLNIFFLECPTTLKILSLKYMLTNT